MKRQIDSYAPVYNKRIKTESVFKPLSEFIITKDIDRILVDFITPESINRVVRINKYCMEIFHSKATEWQLVRSNTDPLELACTNNYGWIVEYMIIKYKQNTDVMKIYSMANNHVNKHMWNIAGRKGFVNLIELLHKYRIPYVYQFIVTSLECAAYNGHLNILKYVELKFKFDLTKCFPSAKLGGHVPVLSYIMNKFRNHFDVRFFINSYSIVSLCANNQIDLSQYLCNIARKNGLIYNINGLTPVSSIIACFQYNNYAMGKFVIDQWSKGFSKYEFDNCIPSIMESIKQWSHTYLYQYICEKIEKRSI